MATGKVKFFNRKKGFGFICDGETEKDVFVHFSGLIDSNIQENDLVTFDIVDEGERKKAIHVKINRKG
jgi:CspA family cold shock protein